MMGDVFIHETAIVENAESIGAGTKVWHWVHICADAVIGRNCNFGQNVFIANDVKIGNGVKIQNNVSVYDSVELEDDVFVGPSAVFTNVVNPRSAVVRKNEYRRTLVRRGASLGANCTIVCGATIGEYAFIGAGAVVTKNVKPFALMVGNPAVQIGWMSVNGVRLDLPVTGDAKAICPETGARYEMKDGELVAVS